MIIGDIKTAVGDIPIVSSSLSRKDTLGAIKVRWLIGRDNYMVNPGIYAVGNPKEDSNVFVTANYKLSFDHLRKNLKGFDAWILVLDSKGVNVWCSAGKGTFATHELVNKIKQTKLRKLINHTRLILPQLGATGIAAYKIKELTQTDTEKGFHVIWGPVKACDIKPFIENGYKASEKMRKVTFTFGERLKLLPVDIVYSGKRLFLVFLLFFLISGIYNQGYSIHQAMQISPQFLTNLTLAYFSGIFITPLLLPFIPVRMFAFKGLIVGILTALIVLSLNDTCAKTTALIAWYMIIPAISSFMAMNFTGSSTYTSLSGVKKEMRIFVPIQVATGSIGLVFYIINLIIK